MSELLLEIFSEEIPASMQRSAEEAYIDIFTKIFAENAISAHVKTFVGPRRITVYIAHLPQYIVPKEVEIRGPKTTALELAIQGFCNAHDTNKDELHTKLVDNQPYYFFIKKTAQQDIRHILPKLLGAAINRYVWPKSMHWGEYRIKWIRPVRNILCLFDGEILPLKFGHLESNNVTYGHRLTKNKQLTVSNFADYQDLLKKHDVIVDRQKRTKIIKTQLLEIINSYDLLLQEDDKLLEEVAGLVEMPCTLIGTIPQKFLKLPREVLTSSMRTHQKYFTLYDKNGKFAPYFLFVANGKFRIPELVIQGNEKVLSARLADALYFYEQDLSRSLESTLIALEKVTFHAKLGSMRQKVERVTTICSHLDINNIPLHLAARFCKSDLVSEIVGEFPELQGIMGYYYSLCGGQDIEVASAIKDHYKPQGPSDNVPTGSAALLALADKIDSVVGLMLAGESPTGSGDPYALRRQAISIIRIILENKFRIDIRTLIAFTANLYNIPNKNLELMYKFFEERIKFYFKDKYDMALINTVLDLQIDGDVANIQSQLNSLQQFLSTEEGPKLLTAYKRVNHILGEKHINGEVNIDYFQSPHEETLYKVTTDLANRIQKNPAQTLDCLTIILQPITDFFDNVMVHDQDTSIAINRLLLLQKVRNVFEKLAKFDRL